MNKVKTIILTSAFLIVTLNNAQAMDIWLQPDDFVGFSFWIISLSCLAATAFFFLERDSVVAGWKAPLTVAGVVTGIAFIHFIYMRNLWVTTSDLPIIYKYIDWLITMPLLTIQFYLILFATKKVSSIIFWKLLFASVIMVCGGYAGEAGYILPFLGFIIWMLGWIYILYELYSGEVSILISKTSNEHLVTAFERMRLIVTFGWTIYPLGYVFGYLTAGIDYNSLNVIYNFGDLINKIGFGLAIWVAARQS